MAETRDGTATGGDGKPRGDGGSTDSPEEWSEAKLAERLRRGGEVAWRHFDRVLRPVLLQRALWITGDWDEAEDLVSLVTLAIVRQPKAWCNRSVLGMATSILWSTAGDCRRGDDRRSRREAKAAEDLMPCSQGPDEFAERKMRWDLVREAVGGLPGRQKAAWILRSLQCRRWKGVARKMEISVSAAKKLFRKADMKVRTYCQGGARPVVARLREGVHRSGG